MKISTIRWMHSQINVTLGDNIIVVFCARTCIYFRNIHNAWSRTLFQVINELHCPPMASEGPGIRVLSSKVGIRKVSLWIASSLVTGN